ncbi:hypothetical protein [Altibacter sp. HG106]|uniref:hypothetical protein n=1 Tax=Altibacter sp. HG106 TaxID=3023937 RepID=UPI0023507715|nr:hypothetical protein [Altibacter sp. HG106]MDC7995652.1 hypothetical protein [Altibacter sp. HG106]
MKKCITILAFLCMAQGIAQFDKNHAIYSSGEIAFGNYFGIDANLNYVWHEKFSIKAGFSWYIRKPKSQPEAYESGIFEAIFPFLVSPTDRLETYQVSVGRVYKLNPKGSIRVNLSLGVGYSEFREPFNWQVQGEPFIASNYSWEYRDAYAVSLIINPKLEFPISRFYGFTLSPVLQINKETFYIGIGIGQMVGLLRK